MQQPSVHAIEAALLRLPSDQRALLYHVVANRQMYAEAAARVGLDAPTATFHLRAALQQLRSDVLGASTTLQ